MRQGSKSMLVTEERGRRIVLNWTHGSCNTGKLGFNVCLTQTFAHSASPSEFFIRAVCNSATFSRRQNYHGCDFRLIRWLSYNAANGLLSCSSTEHCQHFTATFPCPTPYIVHPQRNVHNRLRALCVPPQLVK